MDIISQVLELVAPHLDQAISFVAGLIATALVFLVKKTKTTVDDNLLQETAEEIKKKK